MKTKEEIENYFTATLNGQLDDLENQRLAIIKSLSYKTVIPYLGGAAVVSTVAYYILKEKYGEYEYVQNNLLAICIFFIPLVAVFAYIRVSAKRKKLFEPLKLDYQSKILGGITRLLHPDLKLEPSSGLSRETFEHSRLFAKAKSYVSEVLTQGTVFGLPIQASLVKYYTVSESKNQKGESRRTTTTHFEGAYCIMKMNTGIDNFVRIKTKSVVKDTIADLLPDGNSNGLVKTLFSTFMGEVNNSVHMESGNKEFDEIYRLEAFDEKTAEQFILSAWIERLMDFRKNQEWEINYYLDKNELHVALGGFNMKGLEVTSPINELVFTQTYINYVNDLLGFAEKISVSHQAISNTHPKK